MTKQVVALREGKSPSTAKVLSLRKKFSISLSGKSVQAFDELKRLTDADTESEVFRNALRLHSMLIHAYRTGKQLYLQDGETKTIIPVDLFVQDVSADKPHKGRKQT